MQISSARLHMRRHRKRQPRCSRVLYLKAATVVTKPQIKKIE